MHFHLTLLTCVILLPAFNRTSVDAAKIDFEDLPLSLANTAVAEEFVSGSATFVGETVFDCCWSGWVYSNSTLNQDLTVSPGTIDSANPLQRAHWSTAFVPSTGNSSNYAVSSFVNSQIESATGRTANNTPIILPKGETIVSLEIANTTWAAHSMLVGDAFGGPFSDNDFFRLTISGLAGTELIGTVEVSLADGRDLLDEWMEVSLTDLHGSNRLEFSLASSDISSFGETSFLNTPAFFAIDNMVTSTVPEPSGVYLFVLGLAASFWCRNKLKSTGKGYAHGQ